MAQLEEFLGELVTSISKSRVNSDLQTINIAKEYAKDNLLQHFAVPRMRIENVEFSIPIAIDKTAQKTEIIYERFDNKRILTLSYDNLLKSLSINKINTRFSQLFKTILTEKILILSKELNAWIIRAKTHISLFFSPP